LQSGKEDESSIQGSCGTDSAKAGTAYSQSRGAYLYLCRRWLYDMNMRLGIEVEKKVLQFFGDVLCC